ncbi:hypothetical protein SAMN04488000_13350 [Lentzea albida]|uniref:Uncharacterized protein n=1 Tax=Lentzea albida TaxID=65499 RepID=A0A1H9XEE1_9PSEU|nr:hypothetical protein SAMN04488000_13350 [Lentzea albida]
MDRAGAAQVGRLRAGVASRRRSVNLRPQKGRQVALAEHLVDGGIPRARGRGIRQVVTSWDMETGIATTCPRDPSTVTRTT